MNNHETTPLVPSITDDTIDELDQLLYELEKRYPDSSALISVEVFADWLTAQLKPKALFDDIPDFCGSGNKARRRAEALGLTIPGAPAVSLVECDACPMSGGCVSTCMKAPAAANPDPFAELPDWRTGCAKNFGGTHNSKGPKDSIGNLTCTCGFNWELPF